jgi:hypothetical protein
MLYFKSTIYSNKMKQILDPATEAANGLTRLSLVMARSFAASTAKAGS